MHKCDYFVIQELVSPVVFNTFGDFAWSFFDEKYLQDLDLIREVSGSPIIINDWLWGGKFTQSGLRTNIDPIVVAKKRPYCSGHVLAKGFDLKDGNGNNRELYERVWRLMLQGRLKGFTRLEHIQHTPSWVHVDGLRTASGQPEIFTI